MHEAALVRSLISRAEAVAMAEGAVRVSAVELRQGRLGHVSPEHLRDHFDRAAMGTLLEGAEVSVHEAGDDDSLVLVAVTVEDA